MKEIDIEIVTSSEEDYTEIYSLVTYISKKLGIDTSKASRKFFETCNRLRMKIPLEIYSSDKVYGEMNLEQWREIYPDEIVNNVGELSGPPYYYIRVNTSQDFGYYINLVKTTDIN